MTSHALRCSCVACVRKERPDAFLPIRAERTDWTSPEWMADAACTEFYGDFWFPENGETPHAANRICRSCDVRERCLDFALSMDSPPAGVWGGTVERERRQMRRRSA
jgi:WhiB family redox-sensing transcriptional regulator